MTASRLLHAFTVLGRRHTGSRAALGWLLVSLAFSGASARAAEETSEQIIPRLEFRVNDATGQAGPVPSFRYSYEILAADREEPLSRLDVAYRSDDGILRIPKPFPPFGRIRVWIVADDGQEQYRTGYGSFSYRIDETKAGPLPTIGLKLGVVVTGKVLDAETGRPIAGAEVAPMHWGHHFNWADWDHAAKTDRQGKYRITASNAEGIAARHPDYREMEQDGRRTTDWSFGPGYNIRKKTSWSASEPQPQERVGPDGFVFRLHPLMTVRGRVLAPDGEPIADVQPSGMGGSRSDREGRFVLRVTREEWAHRDKHKITFYAEKHRTLETSLSSFSLDRESVFTLRPEQVIQGRVLDESGRPLEDCKIELKQEFEGMRSDFYSVAGPYKEGRWEQHIGEIYTIFTLRVSVGGTVRSLKRYSLEEVTRGPLVTRLAEGRRVTGRLTARVPLDGKNTPIVLLRGAAGDGRADRDEPQRAQVQADGSFAFAGLADGTYTLQLVPAASAQFRSGAMDPGAGAFSIFFESPNKPWEKPITIQGADVRLDPIDLHRAALLPGRLTGIAYQPADPRKPFANAFGFVCAGDRTYDTVGGFYYTVRFMTDAEGRFQVDNCPPGDYVLRLSNDERGGGLGSGAVWIHVTPEKTLDLRLFAPESDNRLAIRFRVGDGSPRDVHAGAALDPDVIARYIDKKTGELPFIENDAQRLRATTAEISCELKPLESSIGHWPGDTQRFKFSPDNLKGQGPQFVIPNVTPGRWRLTLTADYDVVFSCEESLLTRDFTFSKGMAPMEILMPPAALVGAIENPVRDAWGQAVIEAIPREPGRPARTCHGQVSFRFIGLEPGEYTLRIRAAGCQERSVDRVLVEKGKTTWLDKIVLKRATDQKGPLEAKDARPGNAP